MTSPPTAEAFSLPAGFRFGVTTAGYQTEGGYNGPGQPANNWSWWEAEGRVEASGAALDFWGRFEEHLDRAVTAGCDAVRLSVEWARCEPVEGQLDTEALDHYGRILDACHDRSLQPVVTLHHFCHPAWLGVDFWLRPDSPERFRQWVEVAADRYAERNRHWVTINEINVYAIHSYLTGSFPPGRRLDVAATVRTLDHMLAAHVLAYDALKRRQPEAVVATCNYPFALYELDRLLADVLLGRSRGVDRHELGEWLRERRSEYHDGPLPERGRREWMLRRGANAAIPLEQALPRAIAAVYDSARPRPIDVVPLAYYDPAARHRRPHRAGGGRSRLLGRLLYDDPPEPAGLSAYCQLDQEAGLGLWIVANGLCRWVDGRSHTRADTLSRPRYLRENLAAVVRAIDAGVPVAAYYHLTLADAYEWGSYQPRFGLFGVERSDGRLWSDLDAMGDDAAGTYRRITDGLRRGDRSVLAGR